MGPGRLVFRLRLGLSALLIAPTLSACAAVDRIPALEERAKSAWSEVQTQHQRRADLIPGLVDTLKGFAQQEREVMQQLTEARSRATQARADASTMTDAQTFRAFQEAQNQLSAALGRLLATVERYPELKSNANFLAARSQLEGTEGRIALARRDYMVSARAYNEELRTLPGRWIAALLYPEAQPLQTFTAAGSERSGLRRYVSDLAPENDRSPAR